MLIISSLIRVRLSNKKYFIIILYSYPIYKMTHANTIVNLKLMQILAQVVPQFVAHFIINNTSDFQKI